MTELHLGEPDLQPVLLTLERRVTLGTSEEGGPDEQHDRLSLGRPICVALDSSIVDTDGQVFLQGRPNSTFWLLALTCSFRYIEDEPIEKAWLEVRLHTAEPLGAADPIAWSMEPIQLSSSVQVATTVKVDGSLKLKSDLLPVEIGPSASRESKKEFEVPKPYVEAYREGTLRPSWIFTRTEMVEVRGVHRLRAVIELPASARGRAEVSAGATLRLKRLGVFPYRARLDDVPEQQAVQFGK